MQDLNFKNWTDNFTQAILASAIDSGNHHATLFLHLKLKGSVNALNEVCEKIHSATSPVEFYHTLCIFIQEAKQTIYWYERSLEYEQVNLNNSQLILTQGKSMLEVLEAALRVIKYQESIN
ncbi:MAG TPA: hypothetical protein PLU53_08525 [Bacteroidia bacterium]|nr:hypothetical protein [Bacteroidia bacterium]